MVPKVTRPLASRVSKNLTRLSAAAFSEVTPKLSKKYMDVISLEV